jgi:tetratricopeptide (TPR) repeat protein/GT2 family glycosyltransferase
MLTIPQSAADTEREQSHKNPQIAERLYKQLLKNEPNNPDVLHSSGVIAYQKGQYDRAVELINKAIKQNGSVAQYHNTLGIALEALGKFQEAIFAYQQAVSIKNDYAEAYHNMAIAFQSLGNYAVAVEECKKAVSLKPDYAKAYNTMAFSLEKQNLDGPAVENYKQAIRLEPNYVEAYNHLGVVLSRQGKFDEAIENFSLALQHDPHYAEAYNNLGIALKEQEKFVEAIANFERALQLEPQFYEAYYNLANSLRDEGRCAKAIEHYQKAIQLKSDYAQAHWNMSLAYLLNGDYIEGWKGYKWRRNADLEILTNYHNTGKPRWDGSSFKSKRLLVHYEQGLGDNIQFARYLPMVKARGGTVIFETLKPIIGLFRDFRGIDELIEYHPDQELSVQFDVYTSLFDLPNIFKTTLETIPSEVPYIHADPEKVEYWRNKLSGDDFKVGIVWAGSPEHGNDRYRSCSLKFFEPLTKIEGVQLYGLQKGRAAGQMEEYTGTINVINISQHFDDFTETAAAIQNLDLIISVDTSVLHLAGAMGKPAWALLPYAPEWRWMLERQDSPWYPTMRLFRQKQWGQWKPVFESIGRELRILADQHKSGIKKMNSNFESEEMIAAIIPGYKNEHQLEKCINHLKNQTLEVEAFIRDNNNDNIYFTAAVNEGISKYLNRTGKYIIILNQDMYLEPDAVEKMVRFMDLHPECGIGAPLQLYSENPDYVIFAGGCEAFPAGKHQHGNLSEFTEDEQIPWCNGACMILRKEMIRIIGLLDENFTFIGSDSDYCFTARARGWQVWRIAAAKGIHERGASSSSPDVNTELLKIKDMLYFGKKWLTGELFKELSYEGQNINPEMVGDIMNDLMETKDELENYGCMEAQTNLATS